MRNSRVDYVESKLDEAIRSLKEATEKSEARLEARLVADRQASEARLAADRQVSEERLAADRQAMEMRLENERKAAENRLAADREEFKEERKEWRSTKRWLYLNFVGVIAIIVTVVLAILNGDNPF